MQYRKYNNYVTVSVYHLAGVPGYRLFQEEKREPTCILTACYRICNKSV